MMDMLCTACDGLGHDDDILCPMPCDRCNGSGIEDGGVEDYWDYDPTVARERSEHLSPRQVVQPIRDEQNPSSNHGDKAR